jgi:hypothetical protein
MKLKKQSRRTTGSRFFFSDMGEENFLAIAVDIR